MKLRNSYSIVKELCPRCPGTKKCPRCPGTQQLLTIIWKIKQSSQDIFTIISIC